MNISFVASPLTKYAFFASLHEINGIFIQKIEYPLCIYRVENSVDPDQMASSEAS